MTATEALTLFAPDPTEEAKRLGASSMDPIRRNLEAFLCVLVHAKKSITPELVDEWYPLDGAPVALKRVDEFNELTVDFPGGG